jgi:hypothetical protein
MSNHIPELMWCRSCNTLRVSRPNSTLCLACQQLLEEGWEEIELESLELLEEVG